MAVVNKFNVNKQQVTLDPDIIENMSANDVSYNDSSLYDKNTVGKKLSELGTQVIYDVTENNNGVTFASLSELLSSENLSTLIPTSVRCGGMSIRFVHSSDNKYVQFRLMANAFTTDVAQWQGIDTEPIKDSHNVAESGGTYKVIALTNEESPYNNQDVLQFITDEENVIVGYIYKDGHIEMLNDTNKVRIYNLEEVTEDIERRVDNIEELDAFISSESPLDDEDVLKYIIDDDMNCIAVVHKDGVIENLAVSMSPYNDENVLKYVTDENGITIGYIKKDGTIHLYKAEIDNFDNANDAVKKLTTVVGLLANSADNITMSNNKKFINTLMNISTPKPIEFKVSDDNNVNLKPCISIIDDDTVDFQIPSSFGSLVPNENQGGYFSVLLPFILSLEAKHNKKCPVGLACEGQRVGLTHISSSDDKYSTLNINGQAVKWLHDNVGWNVFNHSMTAQLPLNTYYVDGINSELANTILSSGEYYSQFAFRNTIVLDRLTGKWYEVNSTRTAWVERVPTKKYAMLYYRDYNTGKWYFNRNFDFEYSWGEWVKRAKELGLPNEEVIVHTGSTSNVYTAYASRKYAKFSIRTNGTHNYPPIPATVNRINAVNGSTNVKNSSYENTLKTEIDYCKSHNTWMVFMTHFSEPTQYRNYYVDGVTYPEGINNYPSEWIIPLKETEILDVIGTNEHDYINNPPSRLGISTWDEWYPAPGTQLKSLYDVLDYALSQGIDIVSPMDGWNTHGNIVNLGIDMNGQTYPYNCEEQTPYTDEEQSYLTIGADISVRYFNKKSI